MYTEWMRRGYTKNSETIGEGSFGTVIRTSKKDDPRVFAMKIIQNINPFMLEDIEKEIKAMKTVKSRNTLSAIDHFYDKSECYYCIVTEFIKGGDLTSYLKQHWSYVDIVSFILQISYAFLELLRNGIIHRDLKPANILVVRPGEFMVCDFGCAKFLESNQSQFLKVSKSFGTQLYMAPEVFISAPYNATVDVWSMGVICYQMIYDKFPIPIDAFGEVPSYEHMMLLIEGSERIPFPKTEKVSNKLLELVQQMLCINAKERINWQEIRQFVMSNFDYTIEKIDQLLNSKKFLGKLLLTGVHLIMKYRNLPAYHNELKYLRNLLIMVQAEELVYIEEMLSKGIRPGNCAVSNMALDYYGSESPALRDFQETRSINVEYRNRVFRGAPNQLTLKQSINYIMKISKILLPYIRKILQEGTATDRNTHALLDFLTYTLNYYDSFRPRKINNLYVQYRAIKSYVIH